MLLNRLVSVGLMIALGALAVSAAVSLASDPGPDSGRAAASDGAVSVDAPKGHDNQPNQANDPLENAEPGADLGLEPRQPVNRIPNEELVVNQFATGRLIVKFTDQVRARPAGNTRLDSLADRDLRDAERVLEEEGGHFAPLFEQTPEQLRALETRAAHASNVAQPDLAGMMYVQGIEDDETLQRVARRLNSLDIIEFVDIEVPALPMSMISEGVPKQAIETYRRAAQMAAQRANPQVTERTRFEAQVNEAFSLKQSTVDRINVPKDPQGVFDIEIPIHGLPVTMRLEPHSVRAENFQMYEALPDGSMRPVDLGPERTYRGQLVGFHGSQVAATVFEESVVATVFMPDGQTFSIEPVRMRISDVDPAEHVVYECRDAIEDRGQCGFGHEQKIGAPVVPNADQHRHQQGVAQGGGGFNGCYAQIALDLDHLWVSGFESLQLAGLLSTNLINVVNLQFENDVNIRHAISAVVARTSEAADPYTTNDAGILLTQFRQHWNNPSNPEHFFPRDVAHLLTGRNLLGATIGVAFPNAICSPFPWDPPGSTSRAYGLSQRFQPFGCQSDLVAHELGHNWGAVHCDCGGFVPEDVWTMNASITCANKFNPDDTIPVINEFRQVLQAFLPGCLDCGGDEPAACGLAAHSCLVDSTNGGADPGEPYCDDDSCCGTVCAIKAECCTDVWDAECAQLATQFCPFLGEPCGIANSGHCLTASLSPGCADANCCNVVRAVEESCAVVWDEKCAILAGLLCFHNMDQPTPDLTAFQAYRTSTPTPGFDFLTGGPRGEGFDIDALYAIGQELADLGVGDENLARGKSMRVAVIESAFFENHEDLDVTPEPGQTMWLNPLVTDPDHGTAVLGIISAVENDFGMTGLAPDADAYFFPTFSLENGGRLPSAILSAIDEFEAGDVMNFSIGFPIGASGFDCAEASQYLTSRPGIYPLILLASQLGISSVMSAGNSCCDLEGTGEAGDVDSGAFIISAVEPGFPYCRESFSNFTGTPNTRPPHFSGWGSSVATLGFGDLWTEAADAGSDRAYTMAFSGTSAAAPKIAGVVVNLQGLMKQFYGGISLMPTQIRDNWAGFSQCLLSPQPHPDMLGWCDDFEENPIGACEGDIRPQDPPGPDDCPGTLAHVANFPSATGWAAVLLDSTFFPDTKFDEIHTIRGTYLGGNAFSVSAFDGIVYTAESEPTSGGSSPSFIPSGFEGPLSNVVYRATGQIADVLFVHTSDISSNISSLTVELVFGPTQVPGFAFVELYDWDNSFWSIAAMSFTAGGGGCAVPPGHPLEEECSVNPPTWTFNPSRFVNNDTNEVLMRAWAFGFQTPPGPGNPPEQQTFTFPIDLLDLNIVSFGVHDTNDD